MGAVYLNKAENVKLLLAVPGIQVNLKGTMGWTAGFTALMIAVKEGNAEIAKLLLAVPVIDVDAKDKNGTTALKRAKQKLAYEAQHRADRLEHVNPDDHDWLCLQDIIENLKKAGAKE